MIRSTRKTLHKKRTHKKTHKKTYKGGFRYGRQNDLRTPTPGEILIARSPKKKLRHGYKHK